jgi:hypothetical protein
VQDFVGSGMYTILVESLEHGAGQEDSAPPAYAGFLYIIDSHGSQLHPP